MEMIIEQVSRSFIAVDSKAWEDVRMILAAKVLLDYSSMGGGEPAPLSSGQIIEEWKGIFSGFDATHHQLANFVVNLSGNSADVFCYGTATHYIAEVSTGGNVWTVVGSYNINLRRETDVWKIYTFKFNLKYIDGNKNLPQLARERAKRTNKV